MVTVSAQRAFDVLEVLSGDKALYSKEEIAGALGCTVQSLENTLAFLSARGYVHQDGKSGDFYISLGLLGIARKLLSSMAYAPKIKRVLTDTAEVLQETVYFAVPDGLEVLYVDGAFSRGVMPISQITGIKAPMYCTGIGKAMLAFSGDHLIERALNSTLKGFTDRTITSPEALRLELNKVKVNGFAVDNMEHEHGIKCVGVPVLNKSGIVFGGLSVTGPSLRFPQSVYGRYAKVLKKAAALITEE